jgi:hypothetical protein
MPNQTIDIFYARWNVFNTCSPCAYFLLVFSILQFSKIVPMPNIFKALQWKSEEKD